MTITLLYSTQHEFKHQPQLHQRHTSDNWTPVPDSLPSTSSASPASSGFVLGGTSTSKMAKGTNGSQAPARARVNRNGTGDGGSKAASRIQILDALEIARDNPMTYRETHPRAWDILEKEISRIWRQIEANPNTYVMTPDEFSVFNLFRHRFTSNEDTAPLAVDATARYWGIPPSPPDNNESREGSYQSREEN